MRDRQVNNLCMFLTIAAVPKLVSRRRGRSFAGCSEGGNESFDLIVRADRARDDSRMGTTFWGDHDDGNLAPIGGLHPGASCRVGANARLTGADRDSGDSRPAASLLFF